MTSREVKIREALDIFEHNWTGLKNQAYTDDELDDALEIATEALKREQQFLDAGYKNVPVEFYIGGRKFVVKEIAQ